MTTRREAIVVGAAAIALLALALLVLGRNADAGHSWERASSMSQRRSYLAGAEVDGILYAAGGMVGETGRPLATFAGYDPSADRWQVLPQLPVATRAAAAAAVDGRVYVVGGTTANGNTSAVWAYDPAARRWDARRPLPAPRFNHGAVALDGTLYVLGGYAGGREHRDVFAYRPGANRWVRIGALPRPTHAFGVLAFDGELWVIGGRRGERILSEVWILDPQSRRWRRGPSLPHAMELLGVAAHGDEIHAVWESVHQVFDAGDGRWRDGPVPTVTRHALEAFVVDDALYAIGGCTTALHDSPIVERLRLDP